MDNLKEAGVYNVKQLLRAGASPAGRKELAEKTGLSEAQILKWVNRADLDAHSRDRGRIRRPAGNGRGGHGCGTGSEKCQNLHQKLLE